MSTIDIRSPGGVDASTTKKGQVKLAGDLGGTAASPTVVGVQANVVGLAGQAHGDSRGIAHYAGAQFTPTLLAAPADGYVLKGGGATTDLAFEAIVASEVGAGTFPAGNFVFTDPPALFRYGNACIVQAATDLLTAAEVSNTLINNYGQTVANTQTLPAAAIGMGFTAIIGTAGAGAFHIKAGASDLIYLDGLALHDGDKVSLTTPLVGNCICFWTFQTGVAAYDWFASVISGLWIDGGA